MDLLARFWERGGSVVECRTPEREVGGSKPTAAVLCPWARHFTPRKYWLITQEAVAPSRHDWKIVDWDVKPQHKQTNLHDFKVLMIYNFWVVYIRYSWEEYIPKQGILWKSNEFFLSWRQSCIVFQAYQRSPYNVSRFPTVACPFIHYVNMVM